MKKYAQEKAFLNRKIFHVGVVLVCVISMLGLASIVCGAGPEKTIKIGVSCALTGDYAVYGMASKEGTELAVDEINKAGGINGRKIEIIWRDDMLNIDKAVSIAHELVGNPEIVAITGLVGSRAVLASGPIYQRAEVPTIAISASAPGVPLIGDYIFRVFVRAIPVGRHMGRTIGERLKPKRVGMIHQIDDFELAIKKGVKEALGEYGIPLEPIINYSPGEISDFRPLLAKLQKAEPKPDLAYFAMSATEFSTICIQAKKMRFDIPIVTDGTNHFQDVIKIAGDAVEGVYLNTVWFDDKENPNPLVAKFVRAIQEKYGHEPSSFAIWGYEAIYMLAEALKVNSTDRKAIRDALMKVKRDGALGQLEFDKDGDVEFTGLTPLKIENGKFVLWKNK